MSSGPSPPLISFPTSESAPVAPLPVPHLPFRRISLPSAPNLALAAQRQSVVSFASFESLAEEQVPAHQHRRAKRRSLNPGGRSHRRTQADDDRQAKRAKIIAEFYATEKSYLDGLDLVYNHFLTPILASLDTPKPLLTRNEITTIFSNFIDIWNFHHTFFAALSARLHPSASVSNFLSNTTPLSSLFLAHFPYLSLYTPFITAFPASLAFLSSLSHPSTPNPTFTTFLRTQESHPACAHLRLADYLLTPVQRCPRYLLLLKDLLKATDPEELEWERLQEVQGLVEKITTSLNTSLATHAQTLALISLQRNTRDLPPTLTPLVAPGRELLKRGLLTRAGGEGEGGERKTFDFILLSDYLLWLEREDTGAGALSHDGNQNARKRRSSINALSPSGGGEEKWWCRGHMGLVDMEVVMAVDRPSGAGAMGEQRLELLSPEGSFALYAGSSSTSSDDQDSLTSWITALRTARATRLAALALSNPDSTLSASTSGVHLRRALRAFASEAEDDYERGEEVDAGDATSLRNRDTRSSSNPPRPRLRRAELDSFLPPVWVPDARTDACMRCGRPFGFALDLRLSDVFGWGFGRGGSGGDGKKLSDSGRDGDERQQGGGSKRTGGSGGAWRRKHHCRLCGRVVCATCSGRTFYITNIERDTSHEHNKTKAKPARACDECFEAAFPVILPSPNTAARFHQLFPPSSPSQPSSSGQTPSNHSSTPPPDEDPDTIRGIQPWLSILSRQGAGKDVSETLMAMDLGVGATGLSRSPSRAGLSGSPSRVGLSSSPSRKSRLSSSPSRPSGLRDSYAQTHTTHGASASPSPSKRIVHLPRISSSGDSGASPPSSSLLAQQRAYDAANEGNNDYASQEEKSAVVRPIRIRPPHARPRSYHDILEDFSMHERGVSIPSSVSSAPGLGSVREGENEGEDEVGDHFGEGSSGRAFYVQDDDDDDDGESEESAGATLQGAVDDGVLPREDTARRRKRFSLPAVALQTTPVIARARQEEGRRSGSGGEDGEGGNGARKRFSLVLGGGTKEKNRREREGERDSSAVGLLMDVLRGKNRYAGRN
ncbi:hypothetical protein HYDPIDRAFT_27959 [Hydnomerulius pinastri MD-312]|uniref:DH domain-containing protein n=1 Tax=Hydnomerulius pinastri MD-312 TaxID=994086 RepID=A0A0C9WB20_9AGAM|nr:hypothetical protein HYDPIDRAFT_27959 [Hydnomerulius pinastri MD-312]